MDAEPGPARLQIAAGDDAAAVVPLVKRRRSARVELVAVADEDERPVRMDAMGEGDDTHAAHLGAERKSVVEGKGVSGGGDLGGGGIITKNNQRRKSKKKE